MNDRWHDRCIPGGMAFSMKPARIASDSVGQACAERGNEQKSLALAGVGASYCAGGRDGG